MDVDVGVGVGVGVGGGVGVGVGVGVGGVRRGAGLSFRHLRTDPLSKRLPQPDHYPNENRDLHNRRHPSESWDLMMPAKSPANGDTPAFAGATGLGAG